MQRFGPIFRFLAIVLLAGAADAAECCKNSVAVVASLSGAATVRLAGSPEKLAVSRLDWVPEGATLEVGPGAQAVIILMNGHRYEMSQGARVTLTAKAAPKITGSVRELSPLPPIPKPAPILADSAPTSGAVRLRGDAPMTDLYPGGGTVALAGKVTLAFKPVPGATSYRVALENANGDRLWSITTTSTKAPVADGIIQASMHYRWSVRAMRSGIAMGAGTAEFTTLPAQDAFERAQFAAALGANSGDSAAIELLADVDLRLGLRAEACEEFNAALQRKPDDAVLQRAAGACKTGRDEK